LGREGQTDSALKRQIHDEIAKKVGQVDVNDWREERLKDFKLYAVSHLTAESDSFIDVCEKLLRGGVDVIQLRSKTLSDEALIRIGKRLRLLTLKYERLLIVNDRIEVMLATDADGVHLGQEDVAMAEAIKRVRPTGKFIGRSTHSLEQARDAQAAGADYIGFGPVFETPTKPSYHPVGLTDISVLRNEIQIPVVCIGGINRYNIESVARAGANRCAVVRALFEADDPERAAQELKGVLECQTVSH